MILQRTTLNAIRHRFPFSDLCRGITLYDWMVEPLFVRLSELLGLYKAQHSLFGECPSCGEVFRFSDIRAWHGTPPRDWLTAMRELQKELQAGPGTKPRPKRKRETFVRLT